MSKPKYKEIDAKIWTNNDLHHERLVKEQEKKLSERMGYTYDKEKTTLKLKPPRLEAL